MTTKEKIANKEVLIILDSLNLTDKIPEKVLKYMESNQDENWKFTYNKNLKLEEQKLTRQTIILFSSLYYLYICENINEKERLKNIYIENERKYNEECKKKLGI